VSKESSTSPDLVQVAAQFSSGRRVADVREHGSGNVHDTYLVTLEGGPEGRFILQRINTHVFRRPELIMANMRVFTEHVRQRLAREALDAPPLGRPRWEVPLVLPARDGADYWLDDEGAFWRAMTFIEHARSFETVQDRTHAREAGYALGRFHDLLSDLDPAALHDTLEGFHVTPRYLAHYDQVLATCDVDERDRDVAYGLRFVEQRSAWASVLQDALERGELSLRPIHGDPKINNFMIDDQTGWAVSMIDLDTVKPGLVHYDIGDCLRSCCNPPGEETLLLDEVGFDLDLCKAILDGYLGEVYRSLDDADYAYIYAAIRLIAFELGLRFFTDHLEGNVYFKARHARHNLDRALVQFKLVESIEAQEGAIRELVDTLHL
jgi:Ser/Thr protein kinase RdoA (MazF antagonist)